MMRQLRSRYRRLFSSYVTFFFFLIVIHYCRHYLHYYYAYAARAPRYVIDAADFAMLISLADAAVATPRKSAPR